MRNITSSHWGIGVVEIEDGRVTAVRGHESDPDPSALNDNIAGSLNGAARVLRPAVRESWLEGREGTRGRDAFVEVGWDRALDLVARELTEIRAAHGNAAIFAGSYGWASAGRFHHAQSQLKRFLNTIGGFVRSEGNYSYNAAIAAMPHIVGGPFRDQIAQATRWPVIAEHGRLVVAFGGLPMRNMQISDGGAGRHRMAGNLAACIENGVAFVNISPLRSDVDASARAEWLAPRPGTDVAMMLGLAHTLMAEGLHDRAFIDRYTVGFDRFAAYLTGTSDGVAKDAGWAARICGVPAETLRALARRMAGTRTLITCAAGLQRADWGEQPLWMTVTLAAMLGQIGLPGGGYTIGYAVNGHVGNMTRPIAAAALAQGENPVAEDIPVAMIAEMLLHPGTPYRCEGRDRVLPRAELVWWAGGNPFHHHQDLRRLHRAFQTPRCVIVNELNWTATARHADIVLPVAAAQERLDFGAGRSDNILVPMPKLAEPPGQARTEYAIYRDLARRMGTEAAFTEGRDEAQWVRHLWDETVAAAARAGIDLPDYDRFMAMDFVEMPDAAADLVYLAPFRADPQAHPRATPSGKIELFSETVAGFGLDECPGHAVWCPPRDASGPGAAAHPLALISGQPATRLHSQYDNGALSLAQKIAGREPVLIHPDDAAARGIADGDLVELFNPRGACVAGARVSDEIARGCVFLWTGAWVDFDFDAPGARCRHGNPNMLTHDLRTSDFSQSPASHSARVEVRRLDEDPGPVRAHDPPAGIAPRG